MDRVFVMGPRLNPRRAFRSRVCACARSADWMTKAKALRWIGGTGSGTIGPWLTDLHRHP